MKRNISIKLKALFLFAVFSLNTVVGFACSVGVDMGYNSKHHHNENAPETAVHIHKDGKKHIHHKKKENQNHDKSHHRMLDKHQESEKENDDCCSDEVKRFAELEKAVPHSIKSPLNPAFFSVFIFSYNNISAVVHSQSSPDIKHFVRSYHPPIQDIRIAIQSFQI